MFFTKITLCFRTIQFLLLFLRKIFLFILGSGFIYERKD
ncbi:unknown [Prevotella sp. CAG:1185]|nr:unknown [Prevotella sp. CAG:1185]